jgi:hypothetical protein
VPQFEGRLAAFDNKGGDVGEFSQLRGKDRAGGAGSGDEDVDLGGEGPRGAASGSGAADIRVARSVAIFVVLLGAR